MADTHNHQSQDPDLERSVDFRAEAINHFTQI